MRNYRDFTAKDWLRLQPIIWSCKELRNDSIQNSFLKARPRDLEKFLGENAHLKDKSILQVIAFEQPEVLDFSLKMARRHLTDGTVLVFDNSNRAEARAQIERVCRDRNVAYLSLPKNPSTHPNRSHGMAMTWIWHNVVKALRPAVSGYIDHDIIPLATVDVKKMVGDQPFYGVANVGKWAWSLWAGFCFYNFSAVNGLPLNFLNDFSNDVDTGGRNWRCLYQNHDYRKLRFADWRLFDVADGANGSARQVEVIDQSWMHLAGVSYRADLRENRDFYGRLLKAIEEGANWQQLQSAMGKVSPTSTETIANSKRPRWRKNSFARFAGRV